jgi:hypothetical protein
MVPHEKRRIEVPKTDTVAPEDRVAAAKARLDEPRAESFKFDKPGTEIAGTVARLDVGETEYGETKIVVIDPGDGNLRSVWLFHDALLSQMKKLKPRPGDVIAVRYLGKQKSGNGRSYHAYTVTSDKERPGFDWDGSAGEGGEANPFDEPLDESSDEPPY